MLFPPFSLKNVPELLGFFDHASEEPTPGDGRRSDRAVPPESPAGADARVAQWAADAGKCGARGQFSALLDGPQVEGELSRIFRDTPEFGRSLAERMVPFLDDARSLRGELKLIGGGGEAVVFGRDSDQQAVKLSLTESRAGFGWVLDHTGDGGWFLRPGGLAEALVRFARFRKLFGSGLEIEMVGAESDFLLMRQPFLVGEHPTEAGLADWMRGQGWERWQPEANLRALRELSWRKDSVVATDVRPENAILAEADGTIYPIDFIVGESSV